MVDFRNNIGVDIHSVMGISWGYDGGVRIGSKKNAFFMKSRHRYYINVSVYINIGGFHSHGGTPKSSILIGCSILNRPAIGVSP